MLHFFLYLVLKFWIDERTLATQPFKKAYNLTLWQKDPFGLHALGLFLDTNVDYPSF